MSYRCAEMTCGMLKGKWLIVPAFSINVVLFSVNHWLCLFWPASLRGKDLSFDSRHFSLFFGNPFEPSSTATENTVQLFWLQLSLMLLLYRPFGSARFHVQGRQDPSLSFR